MTPSFKGTTETPGVAFADELEAAGVEAVLV
jgi:hypothetical protein